MEDDGWVSATVVIQRGRPDKKVYTVVCASQEPVRELEEDLRCNGIDPHIIGGAAFAR